MIIQKVTKSRLETLDKDKLSFGSGFTDHMVICEYENGKWGEPRLVPYGPLEFTPAMMGVHYGQACFEGMKAYKDKDNNVFLFRPDKNFARINKSAKRLAIPEIPENIFMEGLKALVDVDRAWVPFGDGFHSTSDPCCSLPKKLLRQDLPTSICSLFWLRQRKTTIPRLSPLRYPTIILVRRVAA